MNYLIHPGDPAGYPERRQFLTGLAALAAGVLLPMEESVAQTLSATAGRIDIHHHFGPPSWQTLLASRGVLYGGWQGWTPGRAIEAMDEAGVDTSMTSITYPGIWFGDGIVTRRLARECNEYGAKMAVDHPGRFGLFAALPLPDVDASLREIEYAFDVLEADGVGVLTSFGDQWLGDRAFAPVFEELNRRSAVVFTHANVPNCCTRGGSGAQRYLVPGVNNNVIEYGTDTTRAIMSIIASGTASRYPAIRFTFSHAGGTMPFLIQRIIGDGDIGRRLASPAEPNTPLYELRRFFYDTANTANPVAMGALRQIVGVSQIVLGTDFPYHVMADVVKDLHENAVFNTDELRSVERENALRLLPKHDVTRGLPSFRSVG